MSKRPYIIIGLLAVLFYFLLNHLLEFLYKYFYSEADFLFINLIFEDTRKLLTYFILIITLILYLVEIEVQYVKYMKGIFITVCSALLFTSLSFTVVTDDVIVKNRLVPVGTYNWSDVDYIEPEIYRERSKERKSRRSGTRYKLHTNYNIHMNNGSKNNAWKNVNSVYRIHKYAKSKEVDIKSESRNVEDFITNYKTDYKNEFDKVLYIFYEDHENIE